LMSFEIHFRVKYNKLLLKALVVQARKMVLTEVFLQLFIIEVVLWILAASSAIAKMTALMLVSAVNVQLIITIKSLPAESALRMALEPTLIDCAWIVVTILLVPSEFLLREELMLVGEHLLVPCAQIAHHLLMRTSHMSM
jgi:hypothetical protein